MNIDSGRKTTEENSEYHTKFNLAIQICKKICRLQYLKASCMHIYIYIYIYIYFAQKTCSKLIKKYSEYHTKLYPPKPAREFAIFSFERRRINVILLSVKVKNRNRTKEVKRLHRLRVKYNDSRPLTTSRLFFLGSSLSVCTLTMCPE